MNTKTKVIIVAIAIVFLVSTSLINYIKDVRYDIFMDNTSAVMQAFDKYVTHDQHIHRDHRDLNENELQAMQKYLIARMDGTPLKAWQACYVVNTIAKWKSPTVEVVCGEALHLTPKMLAQVTSFKKLYLFWRLGLWDVNSARVDMIEKVVPKLVELASTRREIEKVVRITTREITFIDPKLVEMSLNKLFVFLKTEIRNTESLKEVDYFLSYLDDIKFSFAMQGDAKVTVDRLKAGITKFKKMAIEKRHTLAMSAVEYSTSFEDIYQALRYFKLESDNWKKGFLKLVFLANSPEEISRLITSLDSSGVDTIAEKKHHDIMMEAITVLGDSGTIKEYENLLGYALTGSNAERVIHTKLLEKYQQ